MVRIARTFSVCLPLFVFAVVFAACGDDDSGPPDAAATPDAPASPDAPPPIADGAPADAPAPPTPDAPAPDAAGPDTTPPPAPNPFTATIGATGIDLAWTPPADADYAGVLLVRAMGAPVAGAPVAGTVYTVGAMLGAGEEILYVGAATAFTDAAPPGYAHYALFAYDAAPNYSAAATTTLLVPAAPQTGMIQVMLAPTPTVMVTAQPPNMTLSGTAAYDLATQTLTLDLAITSGFARAMFNPKVVLTSINEGALTADGTLAGEPYRYYGPDGLLPGATATRSLVFTGVTGATDPVVLSVRIADHPMLFVGTAYDTQGGYQLVDTGTLASVGVPACDGFLFSGDPLANAQGFCSQRQGVLSADGTRLFSGHRQLPIVRAIDPVNHTVIASAILDAGVGSVDGVVLSRAGDVVFAVLNLGAHAYPFGSVKGTVAGTTREVALVRLDAATLVELGRITFVTGAASDVRGRPPAISPDGNTLAVPVFSQGTVHLFDPLAFNEIDADAATPGVQPVDVSLGAFGLMQLLPKQVAFGPGSAMYVTYARGAPTPIARIDAGSLAVTMITPAVDTVDGGGLVVDDAGRIWIAGHDAMGIARVEVLDPVGGLSVLIDLTDSGGADGHAVAFSTDGTRAFVSTRSTELAVIDVATLTRVDIDGDPLNGVTNVATPIRGGNHWLALTPY